MSDNTLLLLIVGELFLLILLAAYIRQAVDRAAKHLGVISEWLSEPIMRLDVSRRCPDLLDGDMARTTARTGWSNWTLNISRRGDPELNRRGDPESDDQ
jgi:hypothetical protein